MENYSGPAQMLYCLLDRGSEAFRQKMFSHFESHECKTWEESREMPGWEEPVEISGFDS